MRGAHLWKRILNGGILSKSPGREAFERMVLTAPIIVDSRPVDGEKVDAALIGRLYDGNQLLSGYSFLNACFPLVWIEHVGDCASGKVYIGCLVDSRRSPDWVIYTLAADYNGPTLVMGNVCFSVDENMSPAGEVTFEINPERVAAEGKAKAMAYPLCFAGRALDTLQMLGCKNVSLSPHDNDPKQVRRAIKRHGGTPGSYRYHTLVVRPAGSKPGTPGEEIGIMPRHVCRGHFAEYGPEFGKGLLFGKYAGRFFVPPCVKGDKKNGVVEKDYMIPEAMTSPPDSTGGGDMAG